MVGLKVKNNFYSIGTTEFLTSFFNTIQYHLCGDKWGDKYPYVMRNLYNGKLRVCDVPNANKELLEIKTKLKKYSPSKVIWDIENTSKLPPWGNDISAEITSLANYFVTNNGEDLFDVIFSAFEKSIELKWDILIWNMFLRPEMQPKADQDN